MLLVSLEQFKVVVVEARGILAPELVVFMNGTPFQTARFEFGHILVKRTSLILVVGQDVCQKGNVMVDVFIGELAALQVLQGLWQTTVNHGGGDALHQFLVVRNL